jgi:hypothetical protein
MGKVIFYFPQLFQNMYLPIWNNGENGTPVNDQNYYARYVYLTVMEYQDDIRFWEIMNEPDFTDSPYAIRESGMEGSWFDVAPQNINGTTVALTGSPVFLLPGNGITTTTAIAKDIASATVVPNPVPAQQALLVVKLTESTFLTGDLLHSNGQLINSIIPPQQLAAGKHHLSFPTGDLSAGVYICRLTTKQGVKSIRMVVIE